MAPNTPLSFAHGLAATFGANLRTVGLCAKGRDQTAGRFNALKEAMGHATIATTSDLYSHLDTKDLVADLALVAKGN